MYSVAYAGQFRRDLKKSQKQRRPIDRLKIVIALLATGDDLPVKYRDHLLTGNWKGHRECHLTPDWLLIYRIDDSLGLIVLERLGSHSELFS